MTNLLILKMIQKRLFYWDSTFQEVFACKWVVANVCHWQGVT